MKLCYKWTLNVCRFCLWRWRRKYCLPFQGEGDVFLEVVGLVVQKTAQTSWLDKPACLVLDQAEVSCCQCSCSLSLSWLQASAKLLCLSRHCPTRHGNWDHRWCNPSPCHFAVVQNPFPHDHCWILSLNLKDFSKRNPGNTTHVQKPLFLSVCWFFLHPSMVSPLPAALGCAVLPTGKHPSHLLTARRLFPSAGWHFVREPSD